MDILDIRGQRCTDCYAAWFVSTGSYHNHLDWHFSNQCSTPYLTFDTGAVVNEENFGYYEHANPAFTCVSSQDSTTNYWVKQEFDCSSIGGCGGYGSCTANDVCTCDSGYTGTNCQSWKCYNVNNTDSTVCGGHGNCTNINTCQCSTGFTGSQCDTFTCNGIANNSATVCSGHGACINADNCDCADGFSGNNCEYTSCFGVSSSESTVCSGHGACLALDSCACNSSYSGQQCQYPLCDSIASNSSSVCNGHGQCIGVDTCDCTSGYSGSYCDELTCAGVPASNSLVCSGNGVCIGSNNCTCNDGFKGTYCETTIPVTGSSSSESIVSSTELSEHSTGESTVSVSYSQFPDFLSSSTFASQYSSEHNMGTISQFPTMQSSEIRLTTSSQNQIESTALRNSITSSDLFSSSISHQQDNSDSESVVESSNIISDISIHIKSNSISNQIFNRRSILQISLVIDGAEASEVTIEWRVFVSNTSEEPVQQISISTLIPVNSMIDPTKLTIPSEAMEKSSTYRFAVTVVVIKDQRVFNYSLDVKTSTPPPLPTWNISPSKGSAEDIFTIQIQKTSVRSIFEEQQTLFSVSYNDKNSNKLIALNQFSVNNILIGRLPSGFGESSELELQVFAKNSIDGDYSVTVRTIIVYKSRLEQVEKAVNEIETNSETFLAQCVTQSRNLNDIATGINQSEKVQAQEIVEKLLIKMQQSGILEQLPTMKQTFTDIVEMITRNSTLLSEKGRQQTLNIVNRIMDPTNSGSTLSVANILSNVADNDFSNSNTSQLFTQTMTTFVKGILSTKQINDQETNIETPNFQVIVKMDEKASIGNSLYNTTGGGIVVIPGLYELTVEILGVTIIHYQHNPYNFTSEPVDNPVIDVKFYDDDMLVPVHDLSEPLLLTVKKKQLNPCDAEESETKCVYWNVTNLAWQSDGCSLVNKSDVFVCACNHTTSFSAFILYEPCELINKNIVKNSIIWNAIYIVICVPLLIISLLLRNTQPLRSRFIAPVVGVAAILVDSIIQGEVRNALLLTDMNRSIINALSHVIMMTANPLSIIALTVFLWQQIRYLVHRQLYFFMAANTELKILPKLCRLVVSKIVYIVLVATVALFVLMFYGGFTGAVVKSPSSKFKNLTIARAISYYGMLLFVAVFIVFTLLIDIVTSIKKFQSIEEDLDNHSGQIVYIKSRLWKKVFNHITRDDPLYFRVDALLLLLMIIILCAYYSVSIVFLLNKNNIVLEIVTQILEIAFMLCKIAAFGGFVTLISLFRHTSKMRGGKQNDQVEQIILDTLSNPYGCKLLYQYCQWEFSCENVLLWKELEEARRSNLLCSCSERTTMINHLKSTYLQRNCEREVNVPAKIRRRVEEKSSKNDLKSSETEEMLIELYNVVMNNIADTWTRFTTTKEYHKYLAVKETKIELQSQFES
jgi:hypothetical protein